MTIVRLFSLTLVMCGALASLAVAADPPDVTAELLVRDKLSQAVKSPPSRFRNPPPVIDAQTVPDVLPRQIAPLTEAIGPKLTSILPAERPAALRTYAAWDTPPLGAEPDPLRPTDIALPVTARAYVWTPDAQAVPQLARQGVPAIEQITPADDPFTTQARDVMLSIHVLTTAASPLQLNVRIPDPFDHVRAVRLNLAAPEASSPATSSDRPAIVLPVPEAKPATP
jgi:hypothetical protein